MDYNSSDINVVDLDGNNLQNITNSVDIKEDTASWTIPLPEDTE